MIFNKNNDNNKFTCKNGSTNMYFHFFGNQFGKSVKYIPQSKVARSISPLLKTNRAKIGLDSKSIERKKYINRKLNKAGLHFNL